MAKPHDAARADGERIWASDDGAFLQEYFVYFKKKRLNQGVNCPADAAAVLCGTDVKKPDKKRAFRPATLSGSSFPHMNGLPSE